MLHRITVRTERGNAGSLRQDTKIAFAFIPASLDETTHPYDPVGQAIMEFPLNSEEQKEVEWHPSFAFRRYSTRPYGLRHCEDVGEHWETLPGQARTITSSDQSTCDVPTPSKMPFIGLVNQAGSAQNIAFQMKFSDGFFYSIAAFHPLEDGQKISVSSELMLQAYIIKNEGAHDDIILTPELRKRPLFCAPISCSTLPDSSTWSLSQDHGGIIRLVNDQDLSLGSPPSNESLAKSFSNMQNQIATLLNALNSNAQRLTAIEKSITSNNAELSAAQKSVARAHDRLDRLDRTGPEVKAKTVKLEASLAGAEKTIAQVEKSVLRAHIDLTSKQQDLLRMSGKLAAVEEAAGKATVDVAGLDRRIPTIEATVEKMAGTLQTTQADLLATQAVVRDKASSQVQGLSGVQDSVRTLLQQVGALDRRVPVVEARTEQLARAFGQTRDNLTSVNKFLQNTQQQITGLESRLPGVELRTQALSQSLDAAEIGMTALGSRVTDVEKEAKSLNASLTEIRGRGSLGPPPSPNSAVVFPAREPDMHHTPEDPPEAETFPWQRLPQPLDDEVLGLGSWDR